MKRWAPVLLVGVMLVGTAGACDPPPPSGWKAPVVQSVVVTPDPVEAGSTFTIDVNVTDDTVVQSVSYRFEQPGGQLAGDLTSSTATLTCHHVMSAPGPVRDMQITCSVPDFALNGTWEVIVSAADGEWTGVHGAGYGVGRADFEVTGGSNDTDDPVLESVTFEPDPVLSGEPFIVTVQWSDDNFLVPQRHAKVAYWVPDPAGKWWCDEISRQVLTPTLQEWVFECSPEPDLVPGTYSVQVTAGDANGNVAGEWLDMEVVAVG